MTEDRDLIAYVKDGWKPQIRPALQTRQWMDDTRDAFAYRCLPLAMANSHGWEVLNPCAFDAVWDGGSLRESITIRMHSANPWSRPVSIFAHGILTFHVHCLIRTPPDWNLWVTGPVNAFKDGIAPLTGLVETDWSVMTFTMNWRFTRPGLAVHFAEGEPFCHIFPVRRGDVESFSPRFEIMSGDPDLNARNTDWAQARAKFTDKLRTDPPEKKSDAWQKHYFQGIDMDGRQGTSNHQTKLRVKPFEDKS